MLRASRSFRGTSTPLRELARSSKSSRTSGEYIEFADMENGCGPLLATTCNRTQLLPLSTAARTTLKPPAIWLIIAVQPAKESSSNRMIALQDLSLSYPLADGQLDVLRSTSATIKRGETIAVIGPSGSGKTTLLLLLAGLESPTAGSIQIDGVDLASLDANGLADMRRDKLGIIFQSFHLVPSLSALANVALPLDIAGIDGAQDRAREMLERVGLAARCDHYPDQLSGGEQQRVAIARALVHRPAVLLADEPTGNLDGETGAGIVDLLFALNRESGSTLLLVTHDISIARLCDRTLRLHQGQLQDEPAHALSD